MFRTAVLIGCLALSYSVASIVHEADPDSHSRNYLILIDSADSAHDGPLDEGCAKRFSVVADDFKTAVNDNLIVYYTEPTLIDKKMDYYMCLALKRGLLDIHGNVKQEHQEKLANDLRSLEFFSDNFVDGLKWVCPPVFAENFNTRATLEVYRKCLKSQMESFYKDLVKNVTKKQELDYQSTMKVSQRAEKALLILLLKTD